MTKDYSSILLDKLKKRGFSKNDMGYGANLLLVADPLSETIKEMLNDENPRFLEDISDRLGEPLRGAYPNERGKLHHFLRRSLSYIGKQHEVGVMTIRQALEQIYGACDLMKNSEGKRKLRPDTNIVYLSDKESEMIQYIRERTVPEKLIRIVCNFEKF